jgi:7-dehydrocholesterol reductase
MARAASRGRAAAPKRAASSSPKRAAMPSPAPKRAAKPSPSPARRPASTTTAQEETDLWGANAYASPLERLLRTVVGPLLLLVVTPLFINLAALAGLRHDSSFSALYAAYNPLPSPLLSLLADAFPLPSLGVVGAVLLFVLFELVLFLALPGKVFPGARAPSGFVPHFRRNGGSAFVLTALAFVLLSSRGPGGLFPAEAIYDHLLPLLTLLNAAALLLSVLLLVKSRVAPSTPDHGGSEGGLLLAMYWGGELYPSVGPVDLKHFVICRLGMMGWFLFTLSFAFAAAREAEGTPAAAAGHLLLGLSPAAFASVGCNILYVAKFFILFEVPGYMSAADIAVDRFGFMLAWGTMAFMPLTHNLQTLHLVRGSDLLPLSPALALAWVALGAVMIFLNFDADTQRHRVRAAGGKCSVWGRPAEVIVATFADAQGKTHENLLLSCGYLGLVRHFHYLPDIVLLFLYCAPSGFSHPLTFTYFIYLTSLLLDRCQRIDARCAAKYGRAWEEYVRRVPYKLVPGVF